MKRLIGFTVVFLAAQLSAAQISQFPKRLSRSLDGSYTVLVQSLDTGTIYRRNSQTGHFVPFITGLGDPVAFTLGPDGALYVLPHRNGPVRRFDPCDGRFLGNFGDAAIVHSHSLKFGPDGNLYVTEAGGPVKRYNGQTGALLGTFISDSFSDADGTVFGPGGSFFIADFGNSQVLRYSSAGTRFPAGVFLGAVYAKGGLLDKPSPLAIDASGRLYVGSRNSGDILRYNATTGEFLDVAVAGASGIQNPSNLRFAPDGTLFIMSQKNGRLYQLDGTGQLNDLTSDLPAGSSIEFLSGPFACVGAAEIPTLSRAALMAFATLLAMGGALLLWLRRREAGG